MSISLRDLFEARSSVRKYKSDIVPPEKIARILQSVTSTVPTAGNLQAYKIVVVTDPKVKEAIYNASHKQNQILEAPVLFVFFANTLRSSEKYHTRGVELFAIQDAANACMMASLACTEEGLGTCWVGAFHDSSIREILGAGEGMRPTSILTVGFPQSTTKRTKTRRGFSDLVSFDKC
ncbi:putative nitroreductase [Monocercomonoides exilis]|uniref:putative nitroreductase n=1 Tax=Monocercomonoides exilis TaxID=2049356 RepID=UPI003559DB75|nr:putative nitroreductase [Monocercomonoides exilis]|eukprot:MONOS_7739.1-p1 / transcript=MONOS_7739.1 / gene=MONOS_7739 / organism=Monocercomonoides_exilis_PA203 / gene_product=nitroreductase / transcript_product=nitroreductase / location=Mono_scaffold00272:65897-66560(-) / protein_length=177 / sequence_SO=supercontig / SO=protein_coding / is_pseudo=false